jgi:urea carboxylase-associated protein 2
MSDVEVLHGATIEGGKHWSFVIRRGMALRLTDLEGGANAAMLLYNPADKLERYNAPDTLKCQHTFKLTRGHCLYSDMGRVFCSVTEDSLGWHDTVGGVSDRALVAARWGEKSYQEHRNGWTQNGRDAFLVEAVKHGLGRRDLAANVNWFSKVAVAEDGALAFHPGWSPSGASVTLRFEMDALVLLNTCPHPMDPAPEYPRRAVRAEFLRAGPLAAHDPCRDSRPENQRGFANTAAYHLHAEGASC